MTKQGDSEHQAVRYHVMFLRLGGGFSVALVARLGRHVQLSPPLSVVFFCTLVWIRGSISSFLVTFLFLRHLPQGMLSFSSPFHKIAFRSNSVLRRPALSSSCLKLALPQESPFFAYPFHKHAFRSNGAVRRSPDTSFPVLAHSRCAHFGATISHDVISQRRRTGASRREICRISFTIVQEKCFSGFTGPRQSA